jgi:hypothetical protein
MVNLYSAHSSDIEWDCFALAYDLHKRLPGCMPQCEFVKYIWIMTRKIGHDQVVVYDSLNYLVGNQARVCDFVCSLRLIA